MPFPNFPDKYRGRSVLNALDIVEYRQQNGLWPKGAGPAAAIISLERGLPERMRREFAFQNIGRLNGDLYLLKRTRGTVVLTNFGVGSPLVVASAEELIAWGAKRIVSISMAGALQADLNPGGIVVCDRAIRDEGTSYHYLPPEKYVSASRDLVEQMSAALRLQGVELQVGTTWTTDAPFRETEGEIDQYRSEGVKTVEMEAAALFALAQVRQVEAVSVFVIGDSVAHEKWRAPMNLRLLRDTFDTVYRAAVEVLSVQT